MSQPVDWAETVDRLLEGDREACLMVSRLVSGLLAQWRAYDFRDEWPDLIQEVLIAVTTAARDGKIRDRKATGAYIRTVAHNKFVNQLRRHVGRREDEALAWDDEIAPPGPDPSDEPGALGDETRVDLRRALSKLSGHRRRIVVAVYAEGKTYEQVARETGTPLGTLKRYLRDALVELRREFDAEGEIS